MLSVCVLCEVAGGLLLIREDGGAAGPKEIFCTMLFLDFEIITFHLMRNYRHISRHKIMLQQQAGCSSHQAEHYAVTEVVVGGINSRPNE